MFSRIYIHTPYCRQKCPYCAFYSIPSAGTDEIAAYTELLHGELELAAAQSTGSGRIDSVYFGGGTPSLLESAQIERLLRHIDRVFNLDSSAEITLETNPGTVDSGKLAAFRAAGINRLSIGVQSFDDRLLAALGRIHSAHESRNTIAAAHAAGFAAIGIDLICALPGQNLAQWSQELHTAASLAPQHISVYGLTIEENTPFAQQFPEESPLLPDDELAAAMLEQAHAQLGNQGYEHYEIANYARPGYRSRHNSGYWRRDGYLGLGAGAHSFFRTGSTGKRFSNHADITRYRSDILAGTLPTSESTQLSREDAMAEAMYLGLRLKDGIDFETFRLEYGVSPAARYQTAIDELLKHGLLEPTAGGVRLTLRGMLLSNQVFQRFLS